MPYLRNGELVILVSSSVRWNEMEDEDCLYSLVTIGMDRSENAQYRVVESRRLKFPSVSCPYCDFFIQTEMLCI